MKTYKIVRLEKLVSNIEEILDSYPYWSIEERLGEIIKLIKEYRDETPD